MSYRTYFTLLVNGEFSPEHEEEINQKYNEGWDLFQDDQTWFNCDQDMKEYSLKYPELVFTLQGLGEDRDDMWFKYFKNGKMQECPAIITFDKYDETKLV